MKTVIAFLTLFACGQVYSDTPSRCCRPRQFTIRYNFSEVTSSSAIYFLVSCNFYIGWCDVQHRDEIFSRDYTGQRTLMTSRYNSTRLITNYDEHVSYFIIGNNCSMWNIDPESRLLNESCLEEDAVFLREYVEGTKTLQVWNVNTSSGNIIYTIEADTCLTVRQDLRLPTGSGSTNFVLHVFESEPYLLYPELFDIPANCTRSSNADL